MRLRRLSLQHFRNIPLATLEFAGHRQFLVGANGQGKTALLESAGLLTALRSFRTAENRHLLAHGQAEAVVTCDLEHEVRGDTRVALRLRAGAKEVWTDQERVTRLADFIGQFPVVALSSQDQQLIRGSPGGRRRWLDLTLAAMDARYLESLQAYHRALADRNALLKRGAPAAQLLAFERPLAAHGARLIAARTTGLVELAADLTAAYAQMADQAEPAGFAYAPDLAADEAALLARLADGRGRDLALRTTGSGPHRDDFEFTLSGRLAKDFASEGQQRSLVLALRLAQAAFYARRRAVRPVMLADDVLGELDPDRRRRFWQVVGRDTQVIATGTVRPEPIEGGAPWQVFNVVAGAFRPEAGA